MSSRNGNRLTAVALLAVSLTLTGCLDVRTTIDLADTGAGTVKVEYRVDNRLLELGVFDGPTEEPTVPISYRDFELAVGSAEGTDLRSHRVRRGETETEVSVEIEFDSPEAFNALFGRAPDALALDDGVVELVIAPGLENQRVDVNLVEEHFADYTLQFSLTVDEPIEEVSAGSIVDGGRTAELALPVADVVLLPEDLVWRIEY